MKKYTKLQQEIYDKGYDDGYYEAVIKDEISGSVKDIKKSMKYGDNNNFELLTWLLLAIIFGMIVAKMINYLPTYNF